LRSVIPDGSFEEPDGGGGLDVAVAVIDALPLLPSLVPVIVAVPAPAAVTRPEVELTDATPVFELDHETARPVSTLLLASRSVAVAWVVSPTFSELAARLTLTEATGTKVAATVSVSPALSVPQLALMATTPGAIAVTTPAPETVATEALLVLQVTGSTTG
jgi:hypothetical protein